MKESTKKNCGNCANGCYPPSGMKPMYGAGGMMLICCKPRKRKQKGFEMVAPEYKCRDWTRKPADDQS